MNVSAVDRAIRALCLEVKDQSTIPHDWRERTEEELLLEACVCMFSSQMVFEVAEAAAHHLRHLGLLRADNLVTYEKCVLAALSEPLAVERDGIIRLLRPRFKNRLASLLYTTVSSMNSSGETLRKALFSAGSAQQARERLVKLVWGFGPKQASLFLRRVGYCADLAVLDTHILDYLRVAKGIAPKPGVLSRLAGYEKVEAEFRCIAEEFGHSVGCVDFAMWITMRVAKREAIW